jgi:hypothetical protein
MNIRYGQYLFFSNGMQINNPKSYIKYSLIFLIAISLICFIKYNEVDKKLTLNDNKYIELILSDFNIDKEINFNDLDYSSKIQFIHSIQKKIVDNPNLNKMIEKNYDREPKNYYNIKPNICYDNSRVMQKIFNYFDIETTQLAIYSKASNLPVLKLFFTPRIPSHSLTIVHIADKNLIVDSTNNFISLDNDLNSIPINSIKQYYDINWKYAKPHPIFRNDYFIIYGLYSRHGKFYRPFWHFPDINLSEFKLNFINS